LRFQKRYGLILFFVLTFLCCYVQGEPRDGPFLRQREISNACNKCTRCKIWYYSSYIARRFVSL